MKKLFFLFFILLPFFPLAGISVINGLTHAYQVREGGSYAGFIEVQNTGEAEQRVRFTLQDFLCNADGQSFYEAPALHGRSNAGWIELKGTEIVLAPREKYRLAYSVSVPEQLELPGSYWSVVMVEPVEEVKADPRENAFQVVTRVRYAVQVVCTTERPAKAEVKFVKTEVVKVEDRRYLSVEVEGKGELYHTASVSAEFYNTATGLAGGVYKSLVQSVFPYTTRRFMIDITSMDPGKYTGILLAECSGDHTFGLNLSLDVGDE